MVQINYKSCALVNEGKCGTKIEYKKKNPNYYLYYIALECYHKIHCQDKMKWNDNNSNNNNPFPFGLE